MVYMTLTGRPTVWLMLLALSGVGACIALILVSRGSPHEYISIVQRLDSANLDPSVWRLVERSAADVREKPRKGASHAEFARNCQANGLVECAEPAYRAAIRIEAKSQRAVLWHQLALLQNEQGETEAALESMKQSIALYQTHAPSHWLCGFWHLDLYEPEEAEQSFARAMKIDPTATAPIVGLARLRLREGRHNEAAELLQTTLSGSTSPPNATYIRQLLGVARRNEGQFEQSRLDLLQTRGTVVVWPNEWQSDIDRRRTGYRAAMEHAEWLLAATQYVDAVTVLQRVVEYRPNDPPALNNLASAFMGLNQRNDALEILHRALNTDAEYFPTHLNLSVFYEREEPELSVRHARRAAELNPRSGAAHRQVGRALILADRPAAAAEPLARAVSLGACDWDTRLMLGQVLLHQRQWAEAEHVLLQAIESDPNEPPLLVALARAKAEQGQIDIAVQLVNRASQLNPREPTLQSTVNRIRELQAGSSSPQPK
jgi:tetratricopeptide (TPR) repeat protein